MLGLLLSYDPSNTIKAKVSLGGGFQIVDCKSIDVDKKACLKGFVADTENNYCYNALGKVCMRCSLWELGVNFTNVLPAAFMLVDPESVEKYSLVISIFFHYGDLCL